MLSRQGSEGEPSAVSEVRGPTLTSGAFLIAYLKTSEALVAK